MSFAIFSQETPWKKGGIGRVLKEHLRRLNPTEVFCVDQNPEEVGKLGKVTVFRAYNRIYLFSPKLLFVPKQKKILAHGFTTFIPLVAVLKTENLYLIPHYHPIGSTAFIRLIRPIYDKSIGKFILHKAKKIFCVSEFEREHLIKNFNLDSKKLITVYNGVDLERFKNAKAYPSKKKIILYVGRLEKYKNVQLLIRAMEFLPDFKLVIIGNGSYKQELEKISQNKPIVILSSLNDTEVARWFKTCAIFVTLSSIEAFGITVIEALASGQPVLVNKATSLLEFTRFKQVKGVDIKSLKLEDLAKIIDMHSKIKIEDLDLSQFEWDLITDVIKKEMD